ncbi:hypothetical protein LF1_28720 [Rubripirellula obstinata]|uniref:Uncharacterized protein n=1 Tax=Rubripirellula obstinata TaxID=406547 RepID=A0A5B1CLW1_9BACT|nr:hypothetical protein [Rubripirellula obstinata]KAA1260333.1 hypothetical protein LF1_28720 [Rubripirellula obstinata]
MSAKEQKRQKKLAKKRSKELAKKKEEARAKNALQSLSGQLVSASSGAIERCLISESLLDPDQKFGSVLISRKLQDGRVLFVRLLIDGMCLGVKDVDAKACFPSMLSEMLDRMAEVDAMQDAIPSAARKLVESAVAFADQFGFKPHDLYLKTMPIWNDIDASLCETEFLFGNDGKPHFISGPYDTATTIAATMMQLEESVGEGNYDFTIENGGGMNDGMYDPSDDYSPMIDDSELDVGIDEDVPMR